MTRTTQARRTVPCRCAVCDADRLARAIVVVVVAIVAAPPLWAALVLVLTGFGS